MIDLGDYRSEARTKSKQQRLNQQSNSTGAPKMVKQVIKLAGGRLNEQQAYLILIGLVVINLIITTIIAINILKGPTAPPKGFEGNAPRGAEFQNLPSDLLQQ